MIAFSSNNILVTFMWINTNSIFISHNVFIVYIFSLYGNNVWVCLKVYIQWPGNSSGVSFQFCEHKMPDVDFNIKI